MNAPVRIGPYRIERLLGAGSFATVWLGHDASLGASVAIKVLAENWSHDLRVRERFLDEARLLWRLDHERLVRVYSVGELADGRPYSVMAWAEGGSLRDRLDSGPVPVPEALHLLREIAAGVAVLHANGIVHRDLTPGNILFRSARVLIADLGLAKSLAAASGLTARAGTPGYMAPEQDDPFAQVDARTDVFGLGRLGAQLLVAGAGIGVGNGNGGRPVRLRDGVPPKVAAVLRKASSPRPADRYADAAAFRAALDRATATSGGTGGAPAAARRGRTGGRWSLPRAAVAIMAVLGLVGAAAADSVPDRRQGAERTGTDGSGRITVTLPVGWHVVGTGWAGQVGPDGALEPALVMSPAPDRWLADPAVPGAFVGLSRDAAARTDAAGFVAEHPHARCAASPVRSTRQGGVDWVVASFVCATGKPVIVEAAGLAPGSAGLVYVQIAPPAGSGPEFVDALLAGVRTTAPRR